ncbi:MAG TPA: branched-chain amino acid ABC transporter permease [Jiangellaceae bacterium]
MRTLSKAVLGLLAMLAVALLGAAPALAQEETDESVGGVIRHEREPVEGVTLTVTDADGAEVGTAESDAEGRWRVPLPSPGEFVITLDVETLPEGLPPPGEPSLTTNVNRFQDRTVAFRLGERGGPPAPAPTQTERPDAPAPGTDAEADVGAEGEALEEPGGTTTARPAQFWQLISNGLRFGLILGLASLGLSLIFGTIGLVNFSHGELVAFGAITAWFLNISAGLHLLWAALLTVVIAAIFGWAQDRAFWRPLRNRGTGLIPMMIISVGVLLFLRFFYLFIFGGERQQYRQFVIQSASAFGPFRWAPRDLWIMGVALTLMIVVSLVLLRTRAGKAVRAVSDNPALAASSGIYVDRVVTNVWVVGTALAGLAGILFGLIQSVDYLMGVRILLLIFAAVVLGGLGTAWGAMLGGILVGLLIEMSTLVIPPEMKNAGALAILVIILLIRPQGLLGRRERVG